MAFWSSGRVVSRHPRRGFTLVEVLVTIGIITILAGIALYAVIRAQRSARGTAIQFQLQALSTGIDAYRADFDGELPVYIYPNGNPIPDTGAFALCRALFSPADARPQSGSPQPGELYDLKDSAGFRMKANGKAYGPYLQPDNFRFGYAVDDGGIVGMSEPGISFTAVDYGRLMIADKSGRPILYAPARANKPKFAKSNVFYAAQSSAVPPNPAPVLYFDIDNLLGNASDSSTAIVNYRKLIRQTGETNDAPFVRRVQTMLGDSGAGANANNGRLDPDETMELERPYLLWSAGIDGVFGPVAAKNFDDVMLLK